MNARILIVLGLTGWVSLGAWAQNPTLGPELAEETTATWLKVESLLLPNGLEVKIVRRPFAKLVSAGWVVKAGAAEDPVGRTGLAHLVEHLLFQGTMSIGTKDWPRERELLELMERLENAVDATTESVAGVRRNLARVQQPGELAKLWADGGFAGTGALTTKDFSFYTATFPRERLEAWFWLERDRIENSVMRGIQREQRVVLEEELQRGGSGGRGVVEAEFDRFFWGPSPYHRSTDGNPGEMANTVRRDATTFLETHYVPENLSLAIVGDVQVDAVEVLVERYFGSLGPLRESTDRKTRLDAGSAAHAIPARDAEQGFHAVPGGSLFRASCECRASVRVRFPTLAYAHDDAVALDVLAAVLNGRSGRLYVNLVSRKPEAFAAYSTHKALARSGSFTLVAEAASPKAGEAELELLRGALLQELGLLRAADGGGAISQADVDRARAILLAEAAREVKSSDALRTRLLVDAGLRDGARLAEWPERLKAVTPAKLNQLLGQLLAPERGVTFYLTSSDQLPGAAP